MKILTFFCGRCCCRFLAPRQKNKNKKPVEEANTFLSILWDWGWGKGSEIGKSLFQMIDSCHHICTINKQKESLIQRTIRNEWWLFVEKYSQKFQSAVGLLVCYPKLNNSIPQVCSLEDWTMQSVLSLSWESRPVTQIVVKVWSSKTLDCKMKLSKLRTCRKHMKWDPFLTVVHTYAAMGKKGGIFFFFGFILVPWLLRYA